ncbi:MULTISPECIES: hypothetical protein [unclassified Oleiphilus]|uniref:hypothetical protein n=1 Tax=unclassified Oleiphilus TaxID=2631174 RepID=UPI000AB34002|nr:hypothetical protein [Oleiphilaceae bacterium]
MTTLNPVTDKILSSAWVIVQEGFIEYRSAQHHLCYASESVGDSVVVHGLSN